MRKAQINTFILALAAGACHVSDDSRNPLLLSSSPSPAPAILYIPPTYMAPPKGMSPETAAYIDLFKSIGLTQAKASEAAKSAKSAALL